MTYYKKTGYQHNLTDEAQALCFPVTATVTAEQIENVIVSSLEGASTYWCGLDNTTPDWDNTPKGLPVSQYATQLILEGKSVRLYDIEDESQTFELTLQKLLAGIGTAITQSYSIEDDVDQVLQFALFGEIVYT